jgi:phage FluMu protein Com
MLLTELIRIIRVTCGGKVLARASTWYLKTFIAREREPLP